MKCQKCGNNEVNFRYSSNINGDVTEMLLCYECAKKLGYVSDETQSFTMPSLTGMISELFGTGMFLGFPAPELMQNQNLPIYRQPAAPPKTAESERNVNIETSDDIKKRREINMLRERMRKATEEEDFEKAARLRDEIKKIEGAE